MKRPEDELEDMLKEAAFIGFCRGVETCITGIEVGTAANLTQQDIIKSLKKTYETFKVEQDPRNPKGN